MLARTYQDQPCAVDELLRAKGTTSVSVVLPALDEQDTVAGVVASVRGLLGSLVDELVVLDSGSTDATAARARAAGARVVSCAEVLPWLEVMPGKGEVLWRSLAATSGDVLVFLDSDLVEPDPSFVPALLGPMLSGEAADGVPAGHETPPRAGVAPADEVADGVAPGDGVPPADEVVLAKGFYRRPLRLEREEHGNGGGRVTELLARPLLDACRPELSGVIQPLGGEYAVRRSFLESVPVAAGYGVEVGLLLDAQQRHGVDAIAQVNLGVRKHRNRSLLELGVMARQILGTVLGRCAPEAAAGRSEGEDGLTQYVQVAGEWLPVTTPVTVADRPPMRELLAGRADGRLLPAGEA